MDPLSMQRGNICPVLCLVAQSCLILCNRMDCSPPGSAIHGDSLGKNTRVGCHALLQGIFPTQGLNPCLLHWQMGFFYHQHHLGTIHILIFIQRSLHLCGHTHLSMCRGFPAVKNPPANAGNSSRTLPGSRRAPGVGNGNPLQYSCLGNPMEKPGGLQSMGSQKRHDLSTKQQQQGHTHTNSSSHFLHIQSLSDV